MTSWQACACDAAAHACAAYIRVQHSARCSRRGCSTTHAWGHACAIPARDLVRSRSPCALGLDVAQRRLQRIEGHHQAAQGEVHALGPEVFVCISNWRCRRRMNFEFTVAPPSPVPRSPAPPTLAHLRRLAPLLEASRWTAPYPSALPPGSPAPLSPGTPLSGTSAPTLVDASRLTAPDLKSRTTRRCACLVGRKAGGEVDAMDVMICEY